MDPIFFIHSSIKRHLAFFQVLTIRNNGTMNIFGIYRASEVSVVPIWSFPWSSVSVCFCCCLTYKYNSIYAIRLKYKLSKTNMLSNKIMQNNTNTRTTERDFSLGQWFLEFLALPSISSCRNLTFLFLCSSPSWTSLTKFSQESPTQCTSILCYDF